MFDWSPYTATQFMLIIIIVQYFGFMYYGKLTIFHDIVLKNNLECFKEAL